MIAVKLGLPALGYLSSTFPIPLTSVRLMTSAAVGGWRTVPLILLDWMAVPVLFSVHSLEQQQSEPPQASRTSCQAGSAIETVEPAVFM